MPRCRKCKNTFIKLLGDLCGDCFEDETMPKVIKNLTEAEQAKTEIKIKEKIKWT